MFNVQALCDINTPDSLSDAILKTDVINFISTAKKNYIYKKNKCQIRQKNTLE